MNERNMINIAKILKNCPKGIKLYSPIIGEVEFVEVIDTSSMPIRVEGQCFRLSFDTYGRYMGNDYPDAECLLFPSKDCRTWEGWKATTEPEFKIGDFVTNGFCTLRISSIDRDMYGFNDVNYDEEAAISISFIDEIYHLWSIADAEDGDVLVDEYTNTIGIFEETNEIYWHSKIYCGESTHTKVYHHGGFHHIKLTKPATKEQRNLLFKKMKEAGYEWDADKKELRKIIKPKFNVGDWITNDYCAGKVIALTDNAYLLDSGQGIPFSCEHNAHLWTIEDAKDGDVLANDAGCIFINAGFEKDDKVTFDSYCYVSVQGDFYEEDNCTGSWLYASHVKPATKEQRDLLFEKMKEAGYQWDADKKELHKIKHYDISSFYAGMPVLVRIRDEHKWCYVLFSHCYKHQEILHFCAGGAGWLQCIPFNEDTKHLVGTTDMPDEKYINW